VWEYDWLWKWCFNVVELVVGAFECDVGKGNTIVSC
jgi:hypothetical protein